MKNLWPFAFPLAALITAVGVNVWALQQRSAREDERHHWTARRLCDAEINVEYWRDAYAACQKGLDHGEFVPPLDSPCPRSKP